MGIPVIAISALLAASRPDDLLGDGAVRLGLLTGVWYLAYWISSQVNCLADYELDKIYKSRLPRSIDILKGPRTIWSMITLETVVASAIVVYLAESESRVGLVVLWVVGLFLIAAYSLEPLRFKRRGFLNLITLSLILYFLPALYIYYAMAPNIKILPLLALLGFSTQMIGLLLINQIEDYHEDKQMNVLTSTVRWGLKKASLVSLLFTAVMKRGSARRIQYPRQDPIRIRGCGRHVGRVRCDPTLPFQTICGRNFVGGHARSGSRSTSTTVGCSSSIVVLCGRDAVGAGRRAKLDLAGRAVTAVESY